jgi:uncharacterized membrane protein
VISKSHDDQAASLQRPHDMASVVERNIRALIERREQDARNRPLQDRIADRVTRFTGSMWFVYIHLVVYGLWIFINLGWLRIPGVPRFDPTFVVLAMEASVEAIFLSTFVLITQNRMQAMADQRADLDLQVSLLAEHGVTRLISLVSEMAKRMGIEEAHAPELDELKQNVKPERVLDQIEHHETQASQG